MLLTSFGVLLASLESAPERSQRSHNKLAEEQVETHSVAPEDKQGQGCASVLKLLPQPEEFQPGPRRVGSSVQTGRELEAIASWRRLNWVLPTSACSRNGVAKGASGPGDAACQRHLGGQGEALEEVGPMGHCHCCHVSLDSAGASLSFRGKRPSLSGFQHPHEL